MDKLKLGILTMLIGITMIATAINLVVAASCQKDTSTWFWDGVVWLPKCTSCTEVWLTGYNNKDPNISEEWFKTKFRSYEHLKNMLESKGYAVSCVEGQNTFTKGVGELYENRWQLNLLPNSIQIDFSQGIEPNPVPIWCSQGNHQSIFILLAVKRWHDECFEDCLCNNVCNPGYYNNKDERDGACAGRGD